MAMRVLYGLSGRLVAFGNLQINPDKKIVPLSKIFGETTARLLKKDPEYRDTKSLLKLQKRIKRYLTVIARPRTSGGPRLAPTNLQDVLNDLENYCDEEGLLYWVRIVRASDRDLFRSLSQTKIIKLGDQKLRVAKFPHYKSLRQYLFTCLAESLESGEILKIGRCKYSGCAKFFIAKKIGQDFCNNGCRWNYNNRKASRKMRVKLQRRSKAEQSRLVESMEKAGLKDQLEADAKYFAERGYGRKS